MVRITGCSSHVPAPAPAGDQTNRGKPNQKWMISCRRYGSSGKPSRTVCTPDAPSAWNGHRNPVQLRPVPAAATRNGRASDPRRPALTITDSCTPLDSPEPPHAPSSCCQLAGWWWLRWLNVLASAGQVPSSLPHHGPQLHLTAVLPTAPPGSSPTPALPSASELTGRLAALQPGNGKVAPAQHMYIGGFG